MHKKDPIAEFAIELCAAVDFDECFSVLTRSVQKIGFDGVLYTSIPLSLSPGSNRQPIFKVSDAYSASFLTHYTQANFLANDFAIDWIARGRTDIIDWWGEARKKLINPAEQNVILVAREDYGIRNGLTIPTLSSTSEISGVSVVSFESQQTYDRLVAENVLNLECIAKLFHSRVHTDLACRQVFIAPSLSALSAKERDVLTFIATGLPLKMIGDHYSITSGYAKNIVANLCQKLGADNANQLRYLIGRYRLVDLLV